MRYIAAVFLLMGLYGLATSHLAGGVLSFGMVLFICYCHKKMLREDAKSQAGNSRGNDTKSRI